MNDAMRSALCLQDTEYYPFNHGSQAYVPFFLSTAGYGILFNMPGYGVLSVQDAARYDATRQWHHDWKAACIPRRS